MPANISNLVRIAQTGLTQQEAEVTADLTRQRQAVWTRHATGKQDLDAEFGLNRKYRLVFVRCHFAGNLGVAPLTLTQNAEAGAEYDTRLYSITQAGTGNDVNLRLEADETTEPSPWTFAAGDRIRIQWTNPDSGNITWGVEVGLALAT